VEKKPQGDGLEPPPLGPPPSIEMSKKKLIFLFG